MILIIRTFGLNCSDTKDHVGLNYMIFEFVLVFVFTV